MGSGVYAMIDLNDRKTLEKYFDLTDRVLDIIDNPEDYDMPRGDLQGVVEAIIMEAMEYKERVVPELIEALQGLFKYCAMIHKHWGDGDNQKEADNAIKQAKQALAKAGVEVER
jgi:hypothetical protein